jgi:hypothetical protein
MARYVRGFFTNAISGRYTARERMARVFHNLSHRRHGCCGNYGEPGC